MIMNLLLFFWACCRFAAEIFHDLHEEVMVTAARGHGLMVRVQQIEAEFPSIEKALLLQTNHSSFYPNAGHFTRSFFAVVILFVVCI